VICGMVLSEVDGTFPELLPYLLKANRALAIGGRCLSGWNQVRVGAKAPQLVFLNEASSLAEKTEIEESRGRPLWNSSSYR
jgi:hypothetical protein